MKLPRNATIWTAIATLATAAVTFVVINNWQWYRSPAQIEDHLLADTPLGSSEDKVIAHLRRSGAEFEDPWRGQLDPNTSYPPNTLPGDSYIRAVVAEYRVVFTTSVEAFYIFDANRHLVEVAVRKSTDAL